MHNPLINTLNQRVRYRSMTLRRALRNSRISTLSLYVSNTLKLVQKGDTKPKRGKCINKVMLHMGVSCAACHVCRSGIRVNWTNPSPRNKNHKSHQCKFGQTNHQHICRSASHFLFHRRVGGWYRSEFAFRMVVSRRLATKLSRGSTHKHTRNLANWSCRLVSSPLRVG